MDGWISLHRKILDWEWYDDVNVKAVFIDLLLNANYEKHEWHGKTVERGTCITSYQSIADRCGLSKQQVRTAFNKLKSTGEINTQKTNKNTVVIVCNYAKYQDIYNLGNEQEQHANNTQITRNQHSFNTHLTPYNKETKKQRNNIYRATLSNTGKLYNDICTDFPQVRVVNEARSKRIEKFLDMISSKGITQEEYFKRLQASDFLTGRNGRANGVFTFDWVISPDNVIAVCEGKYDNREKKDSSKLKSKPSYDLDEITRRAMLNTEI